MTFPRPATIFRKRYRLLGIVLPLCLTALFLMGWWPGAPLQETDLLMHVKAGHPAKGLVVASLSVRDISVRVRGAPAQIERLSTLELRSYVVPLSKLGAGIHSVAIDRKRIPLPEKIDVVAVKPSVFIVKLEKEIQKQVPVVVTVSGKPKAGFLVSDAYAQPAYVRLRGPQSRFAALEKISTRPVDVSGQSQPFKKEVSLVLPKSLKPFESSGVVVARIVINQKIVIRTFKNVAVGERNTPWPCVIRPATLTVQLKGPENLLAGLFAGSGPDVYVDLKGLAPGVYVRRAVIALPLGTTLVHAAPELFTVSIQKP